LKAESFPFVLGRVPTANLNTLLSVCGVCAFISDKTGLKKLIFSIYFVGPLSIFASIML